MEGECLGVSDLEGEQEACDQCLLESVFLGGKWRISHMPMLLQVPPSLSEHIVVLCLSENVMHKLQVSSGPVIFEEEQLPDRRMRHLLRLLLLLQGHSE